MYLQHSVARHTKQEIGMNLKKLAAAVALSTIGFNAFAVDETGTANVNILSPLAIAETTQIDFGTIDSTDGTCTMSSGGTLSGQCTGSATPGLFTISGTADETVDVSVTAGVAVDGVSYNPVIDGGSSEVLTAGSATVDVFGNLVLSGATSGAKNISYTFTANYQ